MGFPVITRSQAELITPSIWNADLVGNMNLLGPHLIVRKPSDETVNASTTLQDDNDLLLTVGASDVWQVVFNIVYSSSATADFKFAFTQPASGRLSLTGVAFNPSLSVMMSNIDDTGSPTATQALGGAAVGTRLPFRAEGIWVGGGTAGTLRLQWAQNTSDATNTVVHANSTLWAVKLV